MNESSYKRYSSEELRRRTQAGESQTDLARYTKMSEDELSRAIASDPDWHGVPEDWYESAVAVTPKPKTAVSIRLDADLVTYFRESGPGWQTRVNAILKAYQRAKTLPSTPAPR